MNTEVIPPRMISIIVTTYKNDTLYTEACLEAIREWKSAHHELIVVVHDESPLLRAYLEACHQDGLIDILVLAESEHGHTRSFNLGVQYANSDLIFNICNDILIGPEIIDDCAYQLRTDPHLGLIGWHWYSEGTCWKDGEVTQYSLRDQERPLLAQEYLGRIYEAEWFTGRLFRAIKGPKWLQLCNTAFFGARREVLEKVGGGFSKEFPHYFADDFLSYAVLDQGYDVRSFDPRFRVREHFHEFQYDNIDVEDRRRGTDALNFKLQFTNKLKGLNGGMSEEESTFLYLLARSLPENNIITNLGVWKGSSAIVLLEALRDKQATFYFIDCFDNPSVSAMSAQPPISQAEFVRHIQSHVSPNHTVRIIEANTLELDRVPHSDFIFLDAGHTAECVRHDCRLINESLNSNGTAAFHDYDCSAWPDVKPEVDRVFSPLEAHQTVGVYRRHHGERGKYEWNSKAVSEK
ncbi:MAG: class I SAM-dependent methyltransferase [Planctomycetaceae bacterium]|nr:class I SAM-dependent methyltransferase [Planctomycetaceae bacterium]